VLRERGSERMGLRAHGPQSARASERAGLLARGSLSARVRVTYVVHISPTGVATASLEELLMIITERGSCVERGSCALS
jgi:hypothetical protein